MRLIPMQHNGSETCIQNRGLMNEVLPIYGLMICPMEIATSLPASVGGPMLSSSRGGQKTSQSGQGPARASRSRKQASAKGQQTLAISGPNSTDSSPSATLQSSLESRLRAALDVNGSPEYVLTWRHWDMPSGPPICALRALGRRISGSGCTGWPTPNAIPERRGGLQSNPDKAMQRRAQGHMLNLDDAATLAGWATPSARDWKDGTSVGTVKENALLGRMVWQTGPMPSGSPASTGSIGALNPDFVRWLMGYPPEHLNSAPTAMRSSRRSRRSS